MKLQHYFIIVMVIILMIVAGYASRQFTVKEYRDKIAELNKIHNEQTIKQNTEKIKGEADRKKQVADLVSFYQTEIGKLNYTLDQMHQEQGQEIIPWDVLVDFVPDPLPDVITIIKEVFKEIDIVDSCRYSFVDSNNGYEIDFNVRYGSKLKLFEIVPYRVIFEAQIPIIRKRTTISVIYFANNSGGMLVQYRLLPFVSVGGCAGFGNGDPLIGVSLGYVF